MIVPKDVLNSNATEELAGFIIRIEDLTAEKAEIASRIKAEYDMAAGSGFNKKALQQLIKDRASDNSHTIALRAEISTYRKALGGLSDTPLGEWAQTWVAEDERIRRRRKDASTELDEMVEKRRNGDDDNPGDETVH